MEASSPSVKLSSGMVAQRGAATRAPRVGHAAGLAPRPAGRRGAWPAPRSGPAPGWRAAPSRAAASACSRPPAPGTRASAPAAAARRGCRATGRSRASGTSPVPGPQTTPDDLARPQRHLDEGARARSPPPARGSRAAGRARRGAGCPRGRPARIALLGAARPCARRAARAPRAGSRLGGARRRTGASQEVEAEGVALDSQPAGQGGGARRLSLRVLAMADPPRLRS